MSAPNTNAQAKALAAQDLEDLAQLRKLPAFQRYWGRKVLGQLEARREKVLNDRSLTKDQLWEERQRYHAALDTSKMLAIDEAACRSIMESAAAD